MKRIYLIAAMAIGAAIMSVNVLVSQNTEEQAGEYALSDQCSGYNEGSEIYNSWQGAMGGETKVYDVWINGWCPNKAGSFDVSNGVFVDASGRELGIRITLPADAQGRIIDKVRVKWNNYPANAGNQYEGNIYFNHDPLNYCTGDDGITRAFIVCRRVMVTNVASARAALANLLQEETVLHQNAPNPAQGSTKIGYYIPENVGNALLQLFSDSQLVNTWEISQRGEGEQVINTSGLRPGIYYYSLIVDGVAAGTKRMVVQ